MNNAENKGVKRFTRMWTEEELKCINYIVDSCKTSLENKNQLEVATFILEEIKRDDNKKCIFSPKRLTVNKILDIYKKKFNIVAKRSKRISLTIEKLEIFQNFIKYSENGFNPSDLKSKRKITATTYTKFEEHMSIITKEPTTWYLNLRNYQNVREIMLTYSEDIYKKYSGNSGIKDSRKRDDAYNQNLRNKDMPKNKIKNEKNRFLHNDNNDCCNDTNKMPKKEQTLLHSKNIGQDKTFNNDYGKNSHDNDGNYDNYDDNNFNFEYICNDKYVMQNNKKEPFNNNINAQSIFLRKSAAQLCNGKLVLIATDVNNVSVTVRLNDTFDLLNLDLSQPNIYQPTEQDDKIKLNDVIESKNEARDISSLDYTNEIIYFIGTVMKKKIYYIVINPGKPKLEVVTLFTSNSDNTANLYDTFFRGIRREYPTACKILKMLNKNLIINVYTYNMFILFYM